VVVLADSSSHPHLIVPVRLFYKEHDALEGPEQRTCGISKCLEAGSGALPATARSAYVSCSAGAVRINRVVMS
jgi:hypothetical protein